MPTNLRGDWLVQVEPGADIRRIKKGLPALLAVLEANGLTSTRQDHLLRPHDEELFDQLDVMRVDAAHCHRTPGSGQVSFILRGIGGGVDREGASLPGWVGGFLRDDERADNLGKLARSGAPERHVFVPVVFAGATWAVESYLTGSLSALPPAPPDLPEPVTGVWVAPTLAACGVRWDGHRWHTFSTRGEGIGREVR